MGMFGGRQEEERRQKTRKHGERRSQRSRSRRIVTPGAKGWWVVALVAVPVAKPTSALVANAPHLQATAGCQRDSRRVGVPEVQASGS